MSRLTALILAALLGAEYAHLLGLTQAAVDDVTFARLGGAAVFDGLAATACFAYAFLPSQERAQ